MMYDVIITLDTSNPDPSKRTLVISMRIEASSAAEAKMIANSELNRQGYSQYTRSGFSCHDAR